MNKRIKKIVTWIMIVCTVISILPVFGSAAAKGNTPNPSYERYSTKTFFSATPSESELEELRPDNPIDFLLDLFKAIVTNLRSLSVEEILNLPANAMDDLITYIFAAFKFFGVNIDTLYEKISTFFISA